MPICLIIDIARNNISYFLYHSWPQNLASNPTAPSMSIRGILMLWKICKSLSVAHRENVIWNISIFVYLRLSNYVLSWNLLSKHLLIVYKFFVVWREKSILLTKKKPFAFSKCRSHVSKNWASRKTQTYTNVLAKGDNVTFVINGSPKNKVQYMLRP